MDRSFILLRLLVAAHVLGAAAVGALLIQTPPRGEPELAIALSFSLACSQINTCAAWAVLARLWWPWRLVYIALPTLYWCWVHGTVRNAFLMWLAFLGPIAALTALVAMLARMFLGLRIVRVQPLPETDTGRRLSDHRQYSLRALIAATTLSAIAFALARVFAPTWQRHGNELVIYVPVAVLTDAALLYVWSRSRRGTVAKFAWLQLVVIGTLALRSFAGPMPGAFNVLISLFQVGFSAATWHTLNVSGVRLVKHENAPRNVSVQDTGSTSTLPN